MLLSIINNSTGMQELRELIVKWKKNTVETPLKKVDGDWKKELFGGSISLWQTKNYHANRIAHSFYITQWSTAYTAACINGTDSGYVKWPEPEWLV